MRPVAARDVDDRAPSIPPPALAVLASCTHCGKLHRAAPLEFNPVCSICSAERATMHTLGMRGAFPLTSEAIAGELSRTSPGNYALGYLEDDRFVVFYVGRSDSDLRQRLQGWVGIPSRYDRYAPSGMAPWRSRRRGATPLGTPAPGRVGGGDSSYTHFAYSYAPSAEAARDKEHRNHDDFGGGGSLDNARLPSGRP